MKKNKKSFLNKTFKIGIIFIVACIIFLAGHYDANNTHILHQTRQFLAALANKNIKFPSDYLKGIASKPEKIKIEIAPEDYEQLMQERDIAIKRGILLDDNNSEIPIKIVYKGEKIEATAKLKGDFPDHFGEKKYSLRINIKGDERLKKLDKFAIQQPKTRSYLAEWIGHMMLEKENLIHLTTYYIHVTINGEKMGIYQMEEFFDDTIIKNNDLPDGIIFRQVGPGVDLKIYNSKQIYSSENLTGYLEKLYNKYDSLLNGELPIHKIFDVKKMAKYYAITDLLSGHHALFYNNLHFFYNSKTQLIEPIGREWNGDNFKDLNKISLDMVNNPDIIDDNPLNYWLHKKIFHDELFLAEYYKALTKISNHEYLDHFFEEISDAMNSNLNILYKDYPFYNFDRFYLYWNQKAIQEKLNLERPLNAVYFKPDKDEKYLEVKNLSYFPVVLKSIHTNIDNVNINDTLQPMEQKNLPLKIADSENIDLIAFSYLGGEKEFESKVLPNSSE